MGTGDSPVQLHRNSRYPQRAWLGGFLGLDVFNIAITTNACGGPGIVLASVAYDAGIINAAFYTTLVITAVVTLQMAGAWLRFVLSKGWPLLSTNPDETWKLGETESGPVLPHCTEGVRVSPPAMIVGAILLGITANG